jgi:hypothetical protein
MLELTISIGYVSKINFIYYRNFLDMYHVWLALDRMRAEASEFHVSSGQIPLKKDQLHPLNH